MKKRLLCLMASLLLCGAAIAQEPAYVREHDNNMPVVAQVVLDEVPVTTSEWTLKAYIGDDLRGSAQLATTIGEGDTYWIQVYYDTPATGQTNPVVSFKITNGTDVYVTETTLEAIPEGHGTPSQPEVLNFQTVQTMEQTMQFAQGWSWWSSYVDIDPAQALTLLENGLGDDGMMILYQNTNVENYYPYIGYSYWVGSLTGIEVEKGYKVHTSNPINSFTMTGTRVNLESHPITIAHGWNWIGYPVSSAQSINSAFSSFTPSSNDMIIGQGTSSTYYAGYGWYPEINLEPNKAYLYNSEASESKQLVYSNGSKNYLAIEEDKPHNWKFNPYAYPDNAVVIATVFIDGEEQRSEDLEIGAFVDGECRGSTILRYFEPLDKYFTILTIKGQDNDFVDFALFNHGQELTSTSNHIVFEKNLVAGTLDNPYILYFSSRNEVAIKSILFPNPIERMQSFSISIPENETIEELCITNAIGNLVRHSTGAISATNIQGLSTAGVYIVKVVCSSGNTYFDKLIVK